MCIDVCRCTDIASFDTPKAMGEFVGTVKEIRGLSFNVAGTASFANGDGLCFLNQDRQLTGFRVNRVEGNRLYPQHMPEGLRPGLRLYRNNDQDMERLLSRPSAERKIPIPLSLVPTEDGFRLSSGHVFVDMAIEHQVAEKPQRENIIRQLTKLGNTPYECSDVELAEDFNFFIPSSQLAELRRQLVSKLNEPEISKDLGIYGTHGTPPHYPQPHLYNIANREACEFYGVETPTAYELHPSDDAMLMQCRHCLRYALGYCVKHGGHHPSWKEPLFLRLGDGRRFRLEFDCRNCQMNIYAAFGLKNNEQRKTV